MSTFHNTLFVGKVLLQFNKLSSTNKHALNLLSKNKPSEGTVISAIDQSEGRGQIGSNWLSEPGQNLTFSIILYPTFISAKDQFLLNQAIALGVYDVLCKYSKQVKVKWPNDIYIGDKKICGILLQNVLMGSTIQSCIAGIGINVNQTEFDDSLPNPSSLSLETGDKYDLMEFLEQVCEKVEVRYLQLRAGNRSLICKDYLHHLYRIQEDGMYQMPDGEIFEGRIVGISSTGKLQIDHKKGTSEFDVREVSFVI